MQSQMSEYGVLAKHLQYQAEYLLFFNIKSININDIHSLNTEKHMYGYLATRLFI